MKTPSLTQTSRQFGSPDSVSTTMTPNHLRCLQCYDLNSSPGRLMSLNSDTEESIYVSNQPPKPHRDRDHDQNSENLPLHASPAKDPEILQTFGSPLALGRDELFSPTEAELVVNSLRTVMAELGMRSRGEIDSVGDVKAGLEMVKREIKRCKGYVRTVERRLKGKKRVVKKLRATIRQLRKARSDSASEFAAELAGIFRMETDTSLDAVRQRCVELARLGEETKEIAEKEKLFANIVTKAENMTVATRRLQAQHEELVARLSQADRDVCLMKQKSEALEAENKRLRQEIVRGGRPASRGTPRSGDPVLGNIMRLFRVTDPANLLESLRKVEQVIKVLPKLQKFVKDVNSAIEEVYPDYQAGYETAIDAIHKLADTYKAHDDFISRLRTGLDLPLSSLPAPNDDIVQSVLDLFGALRAEFQDYEKVHIGVHD